MSGPGIALPSGLLELSATDYHADRIHSEKPSLSKSVIETLINQSPAHARHAHPRLNPEFVREEDDKFKIGTVAHSVFLEGDWSGIAVLPFANYTTKAAQTTRDESRAHGLTPILAHQADEVQAMVATLRSRCDEHADGPFFTNGTAEKTLVWTDEYDVLCRARLDWIRDDLTAVHDLKSTKASASPYAWDRTGYSIGIDVQACFYLRGCEKVFGCRPDFKFVAVETAPPFELSVFGLTPEAYALAERKVSYALRLWATCLRNDDWPGYPSQTAYIEPPAWAESQWLARELREVAAA